MRRPGSRKWPGLRLGTARLRISMDGAYLRKSTASTATRIRICGVICSMTYDAAKARINSARALVAIAFNSSRSFAPRGDSTSTRQLAAVPVVPASSSTKAAAAGSLLG